MKFIILVCNVAVVKLSESFYAVKSLGETKVLEDGTKSVYALEKLHRRVQETEFTESKDLALSGCSVFIDPDISEEVRRQVNLQYLMILKTIVATSCGSAATFQVLQVSQVTVEGGAKLMNQWFIGCNASHVVCEAGSVLRYLGHSSNLVTVS